MNWPEHILPLPQQTYSAQVDPNLAQQQFEVGFRQRPRFGFDEDKISVTWLFDQFQFDFFKSFVRHGLLQGSSPFTATILGVDGLTSTENVSLQGGTYGWAYAPHKHYRVEAILLKTDMPVADEGAVMFFALNPTYGVQTIIDAAETLYLFMEVHQDDYENSPEIMQFLETYL